MRRFPLGFPIPAIALALLLLGGCGDKGTDAGTGATSASKGDYVFGQEIWLTYKSQEFEKFGRRKPREKEETRSLAETLKKQVVDGADIGEMAGRHSNAPGGSVEGFLVMDGKKPDERYKALLATPVGGLTATLDWYGGFWFAKRIPSEKGMNLWAQFDRAPKDRRARAQAIAIGYKGMVPFRFDVKEPKSVAIAAAEDLLQRLENGADFTELARKYSNDNHSPDGVIHVPRPGKWDDWLTPFDVDLVPKEVLDVIFRIPVGSYWPKVIVTDRGIFLVKVLERVEK